MRNVKLIVAALGLVTVVAGCVQDERYPNSSAQSRSDRYWNSPTRDADRDGIPNRYDRDANGDRVPDRYQGRPAPSRY